MRDLPSQNLCFPGIGVPWSLPSLQLGDQIRSGGWRHQGSHICIILQRHLPAQGPVCRVQTGPLVLSETHSHVLRGHWLLRPSGLEHGCCPWLSALFPVCKSRNLKCLFPSEPQEVGLSKIMQIRVLGPRAHLGLSFYLYFLSHTIKV